MIIVSQVVGSGLTDIVVDENQFETQTGASDTLFAVFSYDGADWEYGGNTVTMSDYGITFNGTPTSGDEICVAFDPQGIWRFSPGKGINMVKLNQNFAGLQQKSNTNETKINNIAATALKADGSNVTQTMIDEFNTVTPNIITGSGNVNLTDNSVNFLTLTANSDVILPVITPGDSYSHTIVVVVAGSLFSLSLGTSAHLLQNSDVDTTLPYSVMYVFNKIDNQWYYCLTQ
jgi:hypothetical protein